MNPNSRLIAALAVVSLAAGNPPGTRVEAFGVVTQARSATVGNGVLSAGASLYEGDTLTTDVDGALTLRASASMIHLGRQSRVTLRSAASGEECAQIDLNAGTVMFSTPQAAAIEIRADQADIQPATPASSFGQIAILTTSSFEIYARRGSLKIQYRDETQTIAEGTSYRVVLDASSDETPSTKTGPGDKPKPVKARSQKLKRILLFPIGGTTAGTAVAAGAVAAAANVVGATAAAVPAAPSNDYESPDHP